MLGILFTRERFQFPRKKRFELLNFNSPSPSYPPRQFPLLAAHFRVPGEWPQQSTYSVHLSLGRTLGWQLAKSSLSHETARIEACIFQEFRFLLLIRPFACTTPDVFSPHVGFSCNLYVFPR